MKESLKEREREKARKEEKDCGMTNCSRESESLKTDPLAPTERSEMRSRVRSGPFIATGSPAKSSRSYLPRGSDWSVQLLHHTA